MTKLKVLFVFLLSAFIFSGCLTVEKKEYVFKLTGKTSGTLTIKYINIISNNEDDKDVSEQDFQELINDYFNGSSIDEYYPSAKNIEKRLYEENGVLCMEVTMNFDNLEAVRLFQYDKKSPIMFRPTVEADKETYLSSNGRYGGETMPVVFWDRKFKELTLSTTVSEPDETSVSLLQQYKLWKGN